jgi:hypothetical protein
MKNLVTIACYRDFYQILLQAESISLFLEPCTHYIIVNEEKVDLDFWYKWLSPYYKNHKLKIIPRVDYEYGRVTALLKNSEETIGWRTQQLQKLLIARYLDSDYLILDAKTIFVKPCSLNEWDNSFGSFHPRPINETFYNTNYLYSKIFNRELLKSSPFGFVPSKMILEPLKRYLEKDNNYENLYKQLFLPETFILNGDTSPASEFLFYNYIVYDYLENQHTRHYPNTFWFNNQYEMNNIEFSEMLLDQPLTISIHRRFLNKCNTEILEILNTHLRSIGLQNKVYPYPFSFDKFF